MLTDCFYKHKTYISLGSNQGDGASMLLDACKRILLVPYTAILARSSVYVTEPQDDKLQPWFSNQVLELETNLEAGELLAELQQIELEMGRIRGERRFGPRTIDLDILLFDQLNTTDEALILPHPKMQDRAFVLVPLLELNPDICLPDGSSGRLCLKKLNFRLEGDRIYQE